MSNRRSKTLVAACTLLAAGLGAAPAFAQDGRHAESGPNPYLEVVPERSTLSASAAAASASGGPRAGAAGRGGKRFLTGFGDFLYVSGSGATRDAVMDETVAANGKVVRLFASWRDIAPADPSPAFDPTSPASPEYDWSVIDGAVRDAAQRNLRPILLITEAPDWAEGKGRPSASDTAPAGTWKPNPSDFADFGTAAARRYSGSFAGLPRVRDFMAWNEPTIPHWLSPQWKGSNGKKPASPAIYRRMLNAFYKAVKGVSSGNRVVTAGTPPYGFPRGKFSMRPLIFWRELLCVKRSGGTTKKCRKARFDALAHHPINTSGGPNRSAISPDDIATPDLHNLVDVLRTSERAGKVKPSGKHPVWATEFWWESSPPDEAKGTPSLNKQARWYVKAMYLLWKQGASMALLYQVRDDPETPGCKGFGNGCAYQTGVYFADGEPKKSKRGVGFPFVADRKSKKKVLLWGVAPKRGTLKVKEKGKKGAVARAKVKPGKVFKEKVRLKGKAKLRAVVKGERSLNWKVKRK